MKFRLRETKREEILMYGTCREMAPRRPNRTCMSPTSLDKNRLARFRPGLGIRARVHVPQSVECRPQSVECRLKSVECRPQSVECRPQSVECRLQSVECRLEAEEGLDLCIPFLTIKTVLAFNPMLSFASHNCLIILILIWTS